MPDLPLLDAAVELRDLLPVDDLNELARSFAETHELSVAILDLQGAVLAGAGSLIATGPGDTRFAVHALTHDGERRGSVLVGPRDDDPARCTRIAAHVAGVLEVLVHAGWVRHLTTVSHLDRKSVV